MSFPRVLSLVLAIGGTPWAFLLLGSTFGILRYSAGGLMWLLLWLPGFVAWYGYIRHVSGHFMFQRARVTWLISLVANVWSLFVVSGRISVVFVWVVLAMVFSTICLVMEWSLREPEQPMVKDVTNVEFRKLLDEHRRNNR